MIDSKMQLGLIDPNSLKHDEKFLIDIKYEMFPDDEYKIFIKGNYLIIFTSFIYPATMNRHFDQTEFPLAALPWFVDSIENKFWGEKTSNTKPNETAIFNNEKVGVNTMKHCCAENLFGYSFWNASRKSYLSRGHQEWQTPKIMLKEFLLDELKTIIRNESI